MEVGDFVFGEEWAGYLHKTLSAFELSALELAHKNELRPDEYKGVGAAAPSQEVSRALLLANLMIGILEDEENTVPLEPELVTLCDGFIAELPLDESATLAAQEGHMLIMKAFTKYVADLTKRSEEAKMGVMVDRAAKEGGFDELDTV